MTNRLQGVRSELGATNATTQPSDSSAPPAPTLDLASLASTQPSAAPEVVAAEPPDMSGDVPLLVKKNDTQLTDAYIAAAGDLAWLRLYFLRDAGDGTQPALSTA